ncbi:beta-mannosidase, partial [bacterium]|nr:beta-mannosidase [bacterium]
MKYPNIRQLLFLLFVCIPFFAVAQEEQNQTLWQPYYVTPRVETQQILLTEDWELGHLKSAAQNIEEIDEVEDWILAERPGTVHWALYRSGKLPNFYKHLNSKQYEWVEDVAWYYRKNVTIPEHAKGKYIFLCFDGVDYLSKVWVNGNYLGRHEGMFG